MDTGFAPETLPATVRRVPVRHRSGGDAVRAGGPAPEADVVAEEVPVALEFNGVSHAVMLASPADLEDFATGFSVTEEIIGSVTDIRGIDVVPGPEGITVQIEIASANFMRLKERRRSLAGRTGCGLCGTESLPQAIRRPAPLTTEVRFDGIAVLRALAALSGSQPLRDQTGATHAAAFCSAAGQLLLVREDVGRHNALDKLIGGVLRARLPVADGFITVTSRASYEMAVKTVHAGVALLAAVSGVTGLAIDVAQASGLCLIGFARGADLNLYTHHDRVGWSGPDGR